MNVSKLPTAVILINVSKAKPFWGKLTLEAVEENLSVHRQQ